MALIGAHVDSEDPMDVAVAAGAEVIQFFLGDPAGREEVNRTSVHRRVAGELAFLRKRLREN